MPSFSVINKATGDKVYEYSTDGAAIEWNGLEFATHDHVEMPVINPDGSIEGVVLTHYSGRRLLSKLEFITLFTDEEYVGLIAAAKQSVPLEAWIKKLDYATPDPEGRSVDLDDPRIHTGVSGLEMMGLIAQGRAGEILNG